MAFYRSLLAGMRERGIRPLVTLYHWDLPQPLEDAGGWPVRATAERFADYAARTIDALGDLADDWITLNEPWCSAFLGYHAGAHAPGRRDWADAIAAAHHLNLAHGLAVAAIRAAHPSARVGIANIVTDIRPHSDDGRRPRRRRAAGCRQQSGLPRPRLPGRLLRRGAQRARAGRARRRDPCTGDLEVIAARTDFAGINHYQRVIARHDDDGGPLRLRETPAEPATTSFGWSVIPESLTAVLTRVSREFTSLPILVTENGASYHDYVDPDGDVVDLERVAYFRGYLAAVVDAVEQGADVRGYYAWSFLDNFEWAEGYGKRFGMVFVDYASQRRIPKLSAHWYQRLIAERMSQLEPIDATR